MGGSPLVGGCRGVDISAVSAPKERWWAAIALSGKLYGVPCNADKLLVYDPEADEALSKQQMLAVTGPSKWRSAVAVGSKVVGLPDRAEHLLVYDVGSGKASFVETRSLATGPRKWQTALLLGGKIYGVPCDAERILVYEPSTGKATGIVTTGIAPMGPAKWLAGAVLSGKLYGMPCNASCILVYDPVLQKTSAIDVSHLACGSSGRLKWLTAVAVSGKLYGIPCHAECVLVYDPVSGRVSGVDTTSVAKGEGKWMSVVVQGSKIYGIPDHADSILIFDMRTSIVSGVSVAHLAEGPFKWQGAAALGGKIYAAPYNAEKMLIFDPSTSEVTGDDTSAIGSGQGKWGMTIALGGRIYGIPWNADQLLTFTPEQAPQPPAVPPSGAAASAKDGDGEEAEEEMEEQVENLPADMGQEFLEDFVALWLSNWIYNVNDPIQPAPIPQLSVGGLPINFDVVSVREEPLQGSPARLGVVTVDLPMKGKVLFFVFKGTSFLTDFIVNANISPDYTPMHRAFGDYTTFVHHGAYHAISQMRVHQRATFFTLVQQAAAAGVERLVITGHSLGGQYALAFLLELFIDVSAPTDPRREPLESPLWQAARCVVFGSPMAFGSAEGTEVRKDLADFFRRRSVNYIHGNDPAPRLWSELDLEGCIRVLAERLRSQIPSALRPLVDWAAGSGGLAQKAEELMRRHDIESHLLRPAERYVHLSAIRLLADGFRPWRPLGQESIVLEDHSAREGYIPAFRNAFDPGTASSLYNESGQTLV